MQLLLLTAAAVAGAYARTALGPLQETMRSALSLSDNQIALLQGPALAVPLLIAAVPLGFLIDRLSRVRLLFSLAVLTLFGSLLTALAPDFSVLLAARCLIGLTAPAIAITAASLIADLYGPAQRGRANMVIAIGQVGGMSAAFALGGALLAISGSGIEGWRWAMLWLSAPLIVVAFTVLLMREPARTGVALVKPPARKTFAELWNYRAVATPLLAGVAMVAAADGAALIWVAPTFARSFALPPDRIGAIVAAVLLVGGILGPIAGGLLADICQRSGGPRRTLATLIGLALLSAPAGLFAVAPGVVSATVLLTLFMISGAAINVMVTTLLTIVIPNELRGLCMSMLWAAGALLGLGLAPVAVSLLSDAIGGFAMIGRALSLVCLSTALIGAAAFALGMRNDLRPRQS